MYCSTSVLEALARSLQWTVNLPRKGFHLSIADSRSRLCLCRRRGHITQGPLPPFVAQSYCNSHGARALNDSTYIVYRLVKGLHRANDSAELKKYILIHPSMVEPVHAHPAMRPYPRNHDTCKYL